MFETACKFTVPHISETFSDLCPVESLKRYIASCSISQDDEFLFRAVSWSTSQSRYSLRKLNKPISYSTVRTNMLDMFKALGLDPKSYGLHSARSGGASCAANNGVRDRLFARHERWKSASAKDGYIKDDTQSWLSVSQTLGL